MNSAGLCHLCWCSQACINPIFHDTCGLGDICRYVAFLFLILLGHVGLARKVGTTAAAVCMGGGMVILQIPTGISAQGSARSKRFTTPFPNSLSCARELSLVLTLSAGPAPPPAPSNNNHPAEQHAGCNVCCSKAVCSRLLCPCPCQFCRGLSWLTPPCFPAIYHLFCNQTIDKCLQAQSRPCLRYAVPIQIHTYPYYYLPDQEPPPMLPAFPPRSPINPPWHGEGTRMYG